MCTAGISQAFNFNWVVGDGGDRLCCKRFQEYSIGSLSTCLSGDNRFNIRETKSCRRNRLYVYSSSKSNTTSLHPILSSFENQPYDSQTTKSE